MALVSATVVKSPCSGSSPLPLAEKPARSFAAAPLSGTDMSPCATLRCSGPGALKNNRHNKRSTVEYVKVMKKKGYGKRRFLYWAFMKEEKSDARGLFLTERRLVDIFFHCLQEAHSLRLRQSQSSYDTNAWRGGGAPRYSLKQRSRFLGEKFWV